MIRSRAVANSRIRKARLAKEQEQVLPIEDLEVNSTQALATELEKQFKKESNKRKKKLKNLEEEQVLVNSIKPEIQQTLPIELEKQLKDQAKKRKIESTILDKEQNIVDENFNPSAIEEEILNKIDTIGLAEEVKDFNVDISDTIPEDVLTKLANYLEEVTRKDIANRQKWLTNINNCKKYSGFYGEIYNNETSNLGKQKRTKTSDTTFASGMLHLWATLKPEILPTKGPVGFRTDANNNEEYELKGEIIKDTLNDHLLNKDKGFYQDYENFLFNLLFCGFLVRKVFEDNNLNAPISRYIKAEDFLFDTNCSSIDDSTRLTHIRYLSKREVLANIENKVWRNVSLDYLNNLDVKVTENKKQVEPTKSKYVFYETHEYLDLEMFFDENSKKVNKPLPYVVNRCGYTNKIVSITPNWNKDDEKKERLNCFIPYVLLPGFDDDMGMGMAQLCGENAKALIKLQQIAIEAAIFQNFPGFIKSKGIKLKDNDISIMPGQAITVESGNMPLRDNIMNLPYNGPSPAIGGYIDRISGQMEKVFSSFETEMVQNSANIPVGTMIAALDSSNKIKNAILGSIQKSFSRELQLIYEMSQLPDYDKRIKVVPIFDDALESTTQRIIKAESLLKIANTAPQMHNMYAIFKKLYETLGFIDVDKFLIKEEPKVEQEQEPLTPELQVQMADIEQRRLEVESRERIAQMNMEAEGYKIQMNIELENKKLEQNLLLAKEKAKIEEENNNYKQEMEFLKLELKAKEEEVKQINSQKELETNTEIELLKLEIKAKEEEIQRIKEQSELKSKEQMDLLKLEVDAQKAIIQRGNIKDG